MSLQPRRGFAESKRAPRHIPEIVVWQVRQNGSLIAAVSSVASGWIYTAMKFLRVDGARY